MKAAAYGNARRLSNFTIMDRPIKKISREHELMMLTMLVSGMRSNPHKHEQATSSADLVTEAREDLRQNGLQNRLEMERTKAVFHPLLPLLETTPDALIGDYGFSSESLQAYLTGLTITNRLCCCIMSRECLKDFKEFAHDNATDKATVANLLFDLDFRIEILSKQIKAAEFELSEFYKANGMQPPW